VLGTINCVGTTGGYRLAMRAALKRFWVAYAVVFVLLAASVLPLCGLMFSCGCTILTGDRDCNMHHASGPHCPWCTGGLLVQIGHFGAILWASVLGTVMGARGGRVWKGIAGGCAGFLVVTLVGGLGVCWITGYPRWMGLDLG